MNISRSDVTNVMRMGIYPEIVLSIVGRKTYKGKDQTGFTKVGGKGKQGGRKTQKKPSVNDKIKSYNGFEILGEK